MQNLLYPGRVVAAMMPLSNYPPSTIRPFILTKKKKKKKKKKDRGSFIVFPFLAET